jgi:hypothetical protein
MKRKCGRDTLPQDLGPLHRLQGCGGVDRQCHLDTSQFNQSCHQNK